MFLVSGSGAAKVVSVKLSLLALLMEDQMQKRLPCSSVSLKGKKTFGLSSELLRYI